MGVGTGLYMYDVVVKKVHVRCLIPWWVLVVTPVVTARHDNELWSPCVADANIIFLPGGFFLYLFMAALWNRAGHYIFILSFGLSSFFFIFSSPNLSRRRLDVCHISTRGVALVRI